MVNAVHDWSNGWIKEGHYISYFAEGTEYYEQVKARDFAHYVYDWHEVIAAGVESGPTVPQLLELTKSYDVSTRRNQIWQVIFGIKGQGYVYVELPTDLHRHGIPKAAKPNPNLRTVSHYEEWMSTFIEPTFLTEHFMIRPTLDRINFSVYNPNAQALLDFKLRFMINKMETLRLGQVQNNIVTPTEETWRDIMDKLHKQLIPCRPLSLYPVRAPAEAR